MEMESWQSLVHVCRRWRGLAFGSPRHLNLQLCCRTPKLSARMSLAADVWPALPLLILCGVRETSVDDVIAGLEHSDRISQMHLHCHGARQSDCEKLWAAMQAPFPELASLIMDREAGRWLSQSTAVVPDSFLGGSAPRLRYFQLDSIPFPGLPRLLLSATHLVKLRLFTIPHSGYVSPEAMATCLSMLTSLETLQLQFESPRSCPEQESRRSRPPTRSILPSLTFFSFKGVNEYLEELVARIDAPQLYRLSTTFFNDVDFKPAELNQFISRTPTLGAYDEARLIFLQLEVLVRLRQSHSKRSDPTSRMVEVTILGQAPDRLLSTLAQICTLSLRPLLTMENLYIDGISTSPLLSEDIENTKWLNLLLPFIAAKNLYLSRLFSPRIAPALQELTGARATEVLPALQNVFLEGFQPSEPVQKSIARFISAREPANHPVAISVWRGWL
jgi:hypothetical protein